MPAVKTKMTNVAGHICSHIGTRYPRQYRRPCRRCFGGILEPGFSLLTWSKQKAMLCYTRNHCFNELSQEWLKSRDAEILITSVLWLNVNLILQINMLTDTKSRITFRSDALVLALLYFEFTVTQSKLPLNATTSLLLSTPWIHSKLF